MNYESNTDEYSLEVGTILPRLTPNLSVQDIKRVIYEEFKKWFGASDAGSEEKYQKLAEELHTLYKEFLDRQSSKLK